MKNSIEEQAREEKEEQTEDKNDLTATGNERTLKRVYRSFVIHGTSKADIHSYFNQAKPHIKTLIADQLKEIQSTNGILLNGRSL